MTNITYDMDSETEVKSGYKKTKIDIIPSDWKDLVFQDVVDGFSSGSTPSRKNPEYFMGDIPWITSGELNYNTIYDTKEKITDNAVKDTNLTIRKPNTFLMAITGLEAAGTRGSCAIVGVPSTTNQSCMALTAKPILEIKYFFYYYCHYGQRLAFRYCQGTKQQSYNAKLVRILPFNLPPLPEQKKIAAILSTWDNAIETTRNLIEQLQLRKKGLMQQLLTGKKRLPGFSGEWEEVKAGEVFSNHTDKNHNGEFEVLSATQDKGVIPRSQTGIDIKYDKAALKNYKKLEKGDFVISLRSFQGGIEFSSYTGLVSPAYTVLRERVEISKGFYKEYMKTQNFINRLNSIIYGIRDGKQISYKEFSSLKIFYPPLKEQKYITEFLTSIDEEITHHQSYLAILQQQKKGLMQQLLTGQKRVSV